MIMVDQSSSNVPIEPGVLSVFRFFVIWQLAQNSLNLLIAMKLDRSPAFGVIRRLAGKLLERDPEGWLYVYWTGALLLLLVYLSLPRLAENLKELYLPFGLTAQIGIMVIFNDLAVITRIIENPALDIAARNWQMFVYLFVPVLLASWQYSFKSALLYIIFSGILDLTLLRGFGFNVLPRDAYNPLGLLFRTILYALVAFVVTRLMAEQRRSRDELRQANEKLIDHAGTLEQLATERERNRLARDLHDTLAHSLSGLVIQLEAIRVLWEDRPEQAKAGIDSALEKARQGLVETRRAIYALRPAQLEELGLILALRAAAEDAARRGGFVPKLEIPVGLPALPKPIEEQIYRFGIEALENVVRHAAAKTVHLSLAVDADIVRCEVKDDGIGFDPNLNHGREHYGLIGLKERAALIGANFHVESAPGEGTVLNWEANLTNRPSISPGELPAVNKITGDMAEQT